MPAATQAERQVAEDLAEQMMLQAEALMAEKARVQALNCALQKERENLLERLEYMEQVRCGCKIVSSFLCRRKDDTRVNAWREERWRS